jgi:hypothetical protein
MSTVTNFLDVSPLKSSSVMIQTTVPSTLVMMLKDVSTKMSPVLTSMSVILLIVIQLLDVDQSKETAPEIFLNTSTTVPLLIVMSITLLRI